MSAELLFSSQFISKGNEKCYYYYLPDPLDYNVRVMITVSQYILEFQCFCDIVALKLLSCSSQTFEAHCTWLLLGACLATLGIDQLRNEMNLHSNQKVGKSLPRIASAGASTTYPKSDSFKVAHLCDPLAHLPKEANLVLCWLSQGWPQNASQSSGGGVGGPHSPLCLVPGGALRGSGQEGFVHHSRKTSFPS